LLLSFLGDLFGPRKCLIVGAAAWGLCMAAMGVTSSYALMIVWRVLLGVTEGPQFSLVNATIKRWFVPREQGRANAIWMVGSPLGSAIGFPLTIYFVAAFGWRASFFLLAALNIFIVLPLVLAVVRDQPRLCRLRNRRNRDDRAPFTADVGLFMRDWRFWMIVIFNSGVLVYLWGLNSWLPTYLVKVRHFDLHQTGIFASLPFVFMFLGEVGGGAFSDWLGRRAIVCFFGLMGAGLLMFAVSHVSNPYAAAVVMALSAGSWGCACRLCSRFRRISFRRARRRRASVS
jgi:predicted MFS family arabinose efflux permease